ncbi:hypothetical protein FNJ88_08255 [Chryseobacterium sp. SNU WT5]|uniref:hypothetical protein n=1 Tax=Chryseobacterium sp. SNU WT5 TaxID=2594269 RepID=UPI00117E7C20|nr:hypothetical protein [Chryseobacterium sp. SNU WT5]QDP85552.1 hypothetical protein FNJ88_08255 [Chryseobacterium sp. SNU WT5]
MKLNLPSKIIFAMLLAFTINSFVYFGFANVYSSTILNYAHFQDQFQSGIYQYRILSGYLLGAVYECLSTLNIDYSIFKLKFINPQAEPQMYLSFYILNTVFIILSAFILVLITESKSFIASHSEKTLFVAVAVFIIGLTQFVIVPYDVSSYFFLLLFFYVLLQYLKDQSFFNIIILSVILLFSTLNRESSALSLSLAATLLYSKFGIQKKSVSLIVILVMIFMAVYFGLRVMSENFTTNDGNLFIQNFTQPKNILGILFWIVFFIFTLILAKDQKAIKHILLFHLLATPYLVVCFYTGILYEIRLYVPLFLTSLILSRISVANID